MTRYNEEVRAQLARDIAGKTVQSLEYDAEGDYYTLTLADDEIGPGFEFSFRYMADLI